MELEMKSEMGPAVVSTAAGLSYAILLAVLACEPSAQGLGLPKTPQGLGQALHAPWVQGLTEVMVAGVPCRGQHC